MGSAALLRALCHAGVELYKIIRDDCSVLSNENIYVERLRGEDHTFNFILLLSFLRSYFNFSLEQHLPLMSHTYSHSTRT